MKKRILAMLLAAMLMVSLLPVSALAADATSGAEYARAVLPDIGFYSSPVASAETLIEHDENRGVDFKFTEENDTIFIIASNGHTINGLRVLLNFANTITCVEYEKCYAIKVYSAWNDYNKAWSNGKEVLRVTYRLDDFDYENKPDFDYSDKFLYLNVSTVSAAERKGFYYRYPEDYYGTLRPSSADGFHGDRYFEYHAELPIEGTTEGKVVFYFDDGNGEKLLDPNELEFGNSKIIKAYYDDSYAEAARYDEHVVRLTTANYNEPEVGTTSIKYTDPDGIVYEIPVTVKLPDFGLYSESIVDASALGRNYELTKKDNVFYAGVANGCKIVEVTTQTNWPKHEVKIFNDGLTAEIKFLEELPYNERKQLIVKCILTDITGRYIKYSEAVNIIFVPETDVCTHTPVTDTAVAATCTATGLTEGSHCSKCNEVLTAQEVVPATGHKSETVKGKAATCTASGLTDGAKCSVCGEVLKAQEEIPVKAHSFKEGKCSVCGAKDPNYVEPTPTPPAVTPTPPAGNNPFTDVPNDAWYAAPVLWAKANNVTGGKTETTFGPDDGCTRAQVVTFLWAANGKPEPKSMNNPFKDVADNAWYLKPVLWAVEQGITGGVAEGKFGPEQTCTRAQIATFLYAAAGKPAVSGKSSFKDVADSDWFAKPIIWAAQNEVTGGIGDGKFGPNNTCTRAQVVTFLYKVYG